jgi:hypothetical protein
MKLDLTKFAGQKDLFRYLVEKKTEIIDLKKSATKFAEPVSASHITKDTYKALSTSNVDDPTSGVIKRTIIANTYNWMDSHYDVHVSGTFKKSITSKPLDKIFHLSDHEYKLTAKVGKFTDVYEYKVQWSNLGINKFGYTEVLMADSDIMDSMHPRMFKAYLNNEVDQHSVGMQYVDITLAINDPENKAEFATWNEYYPMLGNKEKADESGFFWAVKEAKLFEISSVLEGSNELTPTLENKIDPAAANQNTETSTDIQYEAHKNKILLYY